jgi:hypothetical protein
MKHDMTPCIRYRAWLACSGRIDGPEHPANPYEWAYVRESTRLYSEWVQRAWCNYNRQPMPEPSFSGFTHPAFDAWLQRIYLPGEVTA